MLDDTYRCSKCSTPERPTRARLVVWRRDCGYLCAVCAGQQADEPYHRGPPREFCRRIELSEREARALDQLLASPPPPTKALSTALLTRRELAELRARDELVDAIVTARGPRPEMKKGYQGFRLPNDRRGS